MAKQSGAGTKKTKEAIAKAASSGGKAGRKKWTKGRVKDKVQNAVFFDAPLYDKLLKEGGGLKYISVSSMVEKLKISGSLARRGIRHLRDKGLIKCCGDSHAKQYIYTTAAVKKEATAAEGAEKAGAQKGGAKKAPPQKKPADKGEKAAPAKTEEEK